MDAEPRRKVAFDLDGVLIDSRAAVQAAYKAAGVVMPANAWGHSVNEWLHSEDAVQVHERKQLAYREALRLHAKPLAGAGVLRLLHDAGHPCMIVTSASMLSALDALDFLELHGYAEVFADLPRNRKPNILQRHRPACYVDDNPLERPCSVPYVVFVDDEGALLAAIREWL